MAGAAGERSDARRGGSEGKTRSEGKDGRREWWVGGKRSDVTRNEEWVAKVG
jgi:hypothetical protein